MTISDMGTLAALIMAMAALVTAFSQRAKNGADAAGSITGSALALMKKLEAKITLLEASDLAKTQKIGKLEQELGAALKNNAEYLEGIDRLIHQIKSYRQEPVWFPGKPKTGPLAEAE